MLGLDFIQFPVDVRSIENSSYALSSAGLVEAMEKRIIEKFKNEASCSDPRVECEFKLSLYFSRLKSTHSRGAIINILQAAYMVLFALEHCFNKLDCNYFWQIKDFFVIVFAGMIKNQELEQIFKEKKLEDVKYSAIKTELKNFFPEWQSILHGKLPQNPFPDLSFERSNAGLGVDGAYCPLIVIVHGLLNECAIANHKEELRGALQQKLKQLNQSCCFRLFYSKNIKITAQDVEELGKLSQTLTVEDANSDQTFLLPKPVDDISLRPPIYGAI